MRVDMNELLVDARSRGVGVGAMNVIHLELAEAIVRGAEEAERPVVLQISQNTVAYHGALAPIAKATLALAESAGVPVVVHLDHADDAALVRQAVELGITSVMYDASAMDYEANLAATTEVAAWCHDRGVAIEAELGAVGGKGGVHAPGVRTRPEEARAFVEATGVDALAVAVGSSHAMTTRDAVLDDVLIGELAAAVAVPLVLHGSSGVSDEGITSAIEHGMTKINIATHLNAVHTAAVRRALADPTIVDPRKYLGPARTAVAGEVARLLRLFARG